MKSPRLSIGNLYADRQSGSVNNTVGSTATWTGDAAGGGAASEDTCADVVSGTPDVNCDQFQLTVQPGDYTGKVVQVKISWTLPATDYDLYIHKGDVNGTLVASYGNGAPGTSETAFIDPSANGTGR